MRKFDCAIIAFALLMPSSLAARGCPENMDAAARLAGTYQLAGHADEASMVMMMAHVEDDNNLDIFRGSGLTVYGRPVGEFYWYRQPTLSSVTVILPLGGERDGYSAEFHRDYPTAEYNTWRRPQQEGTRDGRLLEANLGSASVLSFADFFYADNRSFQAPSGATLSCKYYRQGG